MSEFRKAKIRVRISSGESVRIMRELQELSQNQLAEAAGIPQSTISAIERERVNLGVERAKVLARALRGRACQSAGQSAKVPSSGACISRLGCQY